MTVTPVVVIADRLQDVPVELLETVRRRIVNSRSLLPFERFEFWEQESNITNNRLYLFVRDIEHDTAVAMVGAADYRKRVLHLLSVCLAGGARAEACVGVLLDELGPCFDTFVVDANHDNPAEHDRWRRLGFRGVSFHRRLTGDRLRFERS